MSGQYAEEYAEQLEKALAREVMEKNKLEIELNDLKKKHEIVRWLVDQILFEKRPVPFICGTSGGSDQNGMYDYFSICASYGSDVVYNYKKVT